jgi:hypothetical protein
MIKVKQNPSSNSPIVQVVPITNITIVDRSQSHYYGVEFPSEDGSETKRGWVGKAKLNMNLKKIQEAVSENQEDQPKSDL